MKLNRRTFLHKAGQGTLAAALSTSGLPTLLSAEAKKRKMTADLVCGNLGISATQLEAIDLAALHGFESVGADSASLGSIPEDAAAEFRSALKSKNLVYGAAGLTVEFRRDDARFQSDMTKLPGVAAGLHRAGVERMSTWLMPAHNELTYLQNFHQHALRLRQVAAVLADGGIRLGLEYVAPRTAWTSGRYPFIHTLAEMKDLVGEINLPNVGFVLDSWHWWHAGDSAADLLTLQGRDVVAVDLNDAPTGIPKEQMPDNHRELPCTTGIIDVGSFLSALNQIEYDGPVRAEPFNRTVNQMSRDDACDAAAASVKKAFALIH